MPNYPIIPLYLEENQIPYISENTYQYKPYKRFPWLQRFLFSILKKLGCQYEEYRNVPKIRTFDPNQLYRIIMDSDDCVYALTRQRVRYILVGRDVCGRIMSDPELNQMLIFQMPEDRDKNFRRLHLGNIEIVLIPWMEGIVAIPDLRS